MPERIQLSRRKGYRKPERAVVVARPSRWGNPWVVGAGVISASGPMEGPCAGQFDPKDRRWCDVMLREGWSAQEVVDLYRDDLEASLQAINDGGEPDHEGLVDALVELRGKDLLCWCSLSAPCHADVLLEIANKEPT